MFLRILLIFTVFFTLSFSQVFPAQAQEISNIDFLKYEGKDEEDMFERVVKALSEEQLLVVIFYGKNCVFCKALFRQHKEAFAEKDLKRKVLILNTDLFPDIALHAMRDRSIPESHYYFQGEKISQFKGCYRSAEELITYLRDLQKSSTK